MSIRALQMFGITIKRRNKNQLSERNRKSGAEEILSDSRRVVGSWNSLLQATHIAAICILKRKRRDLRIDSDSVTS